MIRPEARRSAVCMGGGGAVRPEEGSAHPHPSAAQVRHVFSQLDHGARNQKPAGPEPNPAGTRNPEPGASIQEQSYTCVRKLTLVIVLM